VKNIFLIILTSILSMTAFAAGDGEGFDFKVEIVSKSQLSSFKKSIDNSASHVGGSASLYGHHIDDFIRSFGGSMACTDVVATVSFRLSSLVYLTAPISEKDANDTVIKKVNISVEVEGDKAVQEKLDLFNTIADQQLEQEFGPFRESGFPEEEINQLKAHFRPQVLDAIAQTQGLTTYAQLENFVVALGEAGKASAKAELIALQKKKVKDRLKFAEVQTGIRSLFAASGKCLAGGKIFVYGKFGKFDIDASAGAQDSSGASELDNLRPQRSTVQAAQGAMSTISANVGMLYKVNDEIVLRTDIYLFHDRRPVTSFQNYLTQILSMTDEEYSDHKKIWKINSGLSRLLLKTRTADMYISLGSFDGDASIGVGFVLRITALNQFEIFKDTDTALHLDYVTSDRGYVENAYSVFMKHKKNIKGQPITLYVGYENSEQSTLHSTNIEAADYRDYIIGVNGEIWSGSLFFKALQATFDAYLEGASREVNNSKHDFDFEKPKEGLGYSFGLRFQWVW